MHKLIHITRQRGAEAELLVTYRFMAAGRPPSWPLIPCAYDLLVDTGDIIQRVQVRQARQLRSGVWNVRLTKRRLGKDLPITFLSLDYVCVVCDPNRTYVLPVVILRSGADPTNLVARLQIYEQGTRFLGYLNAFAVGVGYGSGDGGMKPVDPATLKIPWYPDQAVAHPEERKRHHHLSIEEVDAVLRELGPNPTFDTLKTLAARVDVSWVTLRNHLKGKRKDLRTDR